MRRQLAAVAENAFQTTEHGMGLCRACVGWIWLSQNLRNERLKEIQEGWDGVEEREILSRKKTITWQDSSSREQFVGQQVGKRRSHTCVRQVRKRKEDIFT